MEALARELADAIEFAPAREVLGGGESPAVLTDRRRVDAGAVLVTAGAATPALTAPLGIDPPRYDDPAPPRGVRPRPR